MALNTGDGAKISDPYDLLSTYNVKHKSRGVEYGVLDLAPDRSFRIRNGAVVHSPDARDGSADGDDEFIIVRPDLFAPPAPGQQLELPQIAMIHPQLSGITFSSVQNPRVIIEDGDGKPLLDAALSTEFGGFVGVHMGSIIVDSDGVSSFVAMAQGFNVDFNGVLARFS